MGNLNQVKIKLLLQDSSIIDNMRVPSELMDPSRAFRFSRDTAELEGLPADPILGDETSDMTVGKSGDFRDGFISSFTMILVAEIADKTFFIACIMAMRYNRLLVFSGAWGSLVLMTFLSCVVGHVVQDQKWISQQVIHYVAASLFLIFAIQLIYEGVKNRGTKATDELKDVAEELRADDEELRVRFRKNSTSGAAGDPSNAEMVVDIVRTDRSRANTANNGEESIHIIASSENLESVRLPEEAGENRRSDTPRTTSPDMAENDAELSGIAKVKNRIMGFLHMFINPIFLKAFILTFIAEWGDRSQIATVVLAAQTDKAAVFIGGSMGHFVCTLAAVLFGRFISQKVSLTLLNVVGGIVFIAFSGYTFYLAITGTND